MHRARDAGLGGLEFAAAIPGTAGGGVRMNAGRLRQRLVGRAGRGDDRRGRAAARVVTPGELGLAYRHSSLAPGEVVAEVSFRLAPRPVDEIKAEIRALLAQRKTTQPTTKRTFGSVFKNPAGAAGAGRLIEDCGLKGHRIGGAVISERHANFIENAGGATSADALALMAEARRRVHERAGIELEHEVRFWGPLELPPLAPDGG